MQTSTSRFLPLVILLVSCRLASPAGAAPNSGLSAEDLFRPAFFGQVELSPNGKYLAAIQGDDQDMRKLMIVDLATWKSSTLRGDSGYDVYSFRWLGNDRLVFNLSRDKIYSFGLYAAERERLGRNFPIRLQDATLIVGTPKARPNNVLVWEQQSAENQGQPGGLVELSSTRSVIDSVTGGRQATANIVKSYPAPKSGVVTGWFADREGELCLCMTYEQKKSHLHRYRAATGDWQAVPLDLDIYSFLGVDPDNRFLWISHHEPALGYVLRRYDLSTGQMEDPIYRDPDYDLATAHLIFSGKDHRLAGIRYYQKRLRQAWFVRRFAEAQAVMDRAHPEWDNVLIHSDTQENRIVFYSSSAEQPGLLILFDETRGTLESIAQSAPWLKGKKMASTQSISFATRDGISLEGYLTLPPGASKEAPPPLVVLPHGGPWARSTWMFDREVQFLASRGYAVLQPNYRGSTGYSPSISSTYQYDFRRMHDDVTDATRAVQHTGLVDPTRAAIMGGSFGGYLALTGVAFEPELYRCAVSLCGVFDWAEMIKTKSYEGRPGEYEKLRDRLGQPDTDREHFDAISPIKHVAQIRVPVFVAHGTEDKIVSVTQSKHLVQALKQQGVVCETFFRGTERHGFSSYADQVEYYHRVEAFLAKNLKGPEEKAPPPPRE
jgi:dipeptidyl aminopeptidase/acylaminoacyl peptidase